MKNNGKKKGLEVKVVKPYSKTSAPAYTPRTVNTVKQYRPDPAVYATSSVELGDYWR